MPWLSFWDLYVRVRFCESILNCFLGCIKCYYVLCLFIIIYLFYYGMESVLPWIRNFTSISISIIHRFHVVTLISMDISISIDAYPTYLYPSIVGLPTLDLGIPGRPPFPSLPSPPFFSPPLPPSRPPCATPLNQLRGLGERCKLPQWVWGKAPADKRFGAYIWAKVWCLSRRVWLRIFILSDAFRGF